MRRRRIFNILVEPPEIPWVSVPSARRPRRPGPARTQESSRYRSGGLHPTTSLHPPHRPAQPLALDALEHLLHAAVLLDQAADVLHPSAAPHGDAPLAAAVEDVRAPQLVRRHAVDH